MKDKGFDVFISDIEKYINPKDILTIFDIGSRDGNESIYLSEQYPDAAVWAFEPAKESFNNTLRNTLRYPRIRANNIAFSNEKGFKDFYFTQGNVGASSLLKPNEVPWAADQTVKLESVLVDTLDSFCMEKNICPDIIWIDVQGNEANVFKGGINTLKKVKAIYTECGLIPYYEGHTLRQDILDILIPLGFELIREDRDWEKEANLTFVRK